ncbi:MAG: glycosyltransferase family 2 protein [Acholeplasmataceae bacterium]|nr:glycosyltransferase family 2 protein [Acholeplasmataceae bacterium]
MKKISIVVPCYNEEAVVNLFYIEIQKYFDPKYKFQLVFVDDGSKDRTLEIIQSLSENDKRIRYVSFSRNFGKEAAMLAGLEAAKKTNSDAVIMIDADLQDPPSLIPEMLTYYEQGYKHIYTKHKTRKGEPFLKTFFAMLFYKIYALLTGNRNLARGARDFCLLDATVVDAFLAVKDYRRFTKGIFTWVGFEKKCIEFDYQHRAAGKTKWSFRKLFRYALLGIRQFSNLYLVLSGIFTVFGSLILIVEIVIGFINGFNWLALRIEVLCLIVILSVYFMMRLLYEIREQGLNRPIYITKESNIVGEDNEETD